MNTTTTGPRTKYVSDFTAYMYRWFGEHMPDSYDFYITDIDLFIRDRYGRCMVIEVKCRMAEIPQHQDTTLQMIDYIFRCANGMAVPVQIGDYTYSNVFQYHGCHLLQFEGDRFDNGRVYWDGEQVSEAELINFLTFQQ